MIDATSPFSTTPATAAAGDRTSLGANDFMSLLLTQLRHQDPLNPLQPHEFAAQLAGFSSVEQLSQMNSGMADQLQNLQVETAVSKTTFSASLLGRTILAAGDKVAIKAGQSTVLPVDLAGPGGQVTAHFYDENGREVASRSLGAVAGGRHDLTLPNDIPEGTWKVKIDVEDAEGKKTPGKTLVTGVVDKVLFEDGSIVLRVGGIDIPLESLLEIAPSAGSPSSSPNNT